MKRFLAVLLCCCLLWTVPMALAAPTEIEEEPVETEQEISETEVPEEVPEEPAQEEAPAPAAPDLSSLASETAIRSMEVTVTVDEGGRASVTQIVELAIVGTVNEIRFSFPEGAKKCDIPGYWTSSDKENGIRYLTLSNRKGFTGKQSFTLTYTMSGLVKGGDASQILTLPLLSLQDYRIGVLSFTVTLPHEFTSKPRFSSG